MNPPPPNSTWIDALSRAYGVFVIVLACTLMSLIAGIMGVQVFFRYVLNDSLIWAEEVCRYMLILLTFLLIGTAFERGEMISLTFLTNRLPIKVRILLAIPLYLGMAAFLLVLAYYGYRFAALSGRATMPALDFIATDLLGRQVSLLVSMFWLYLAIPVGCVILAGHFVLAVLRMVWILLGRRDAGDLLPRHLVAPPPAAED